MTRGVDQPEVEGYQWDGWKLIMIAKLNSNGTFQSRKWSCVWRPDVGSSLYARSDWMRAGGVGGVAWLQTGAVQSYSYGTGGAEVHVPLADHMGNVRHYYQFKSTKGNVTGQLVASYEYDAFGREVRAWGLNTPTENQPPGLPASRPWADLLPFHYSSKLRDLDSGFNYYGYRFYDPGAGRWLNRDPIAEAGGINLYGMVGNDAVNEADYLGLRDKPHVNSLMDDFDLEPFSGIRRSIAEVENTRGSEGKVCFEFKIWNIDTKPRNGEPPTLTAEPASLNDFKIASKECDMIYVAGHGDRNDDGKGSHLDLSDGKLDASQASMAAAQNMAGCLFFGCFNLPNPNGCSPISYVNAVRPEPLSVDQALQNELKKYTNWTDCCQKKKFKICILFGPSKNRNR